MFDVLCFFVSYLSHCSLLKSFSSCLTLKATHFLVTFAFNFRKHFNNFLLPYQKLRMSSLLTLKMASRLAVQTLFSMKIQKKKLAVDPPSNPLGRSRYVKKTGIGPSILWLFAKNEKSVKNCIFSLIFRF